jgi:signal transduction histidine kinase
MNAGGDRSSETQDGGSQPVPAHSTSRLPGPGASLSARLLVLTVFFVMVAEFLIWAPSVARFRKNWLEDHLTRAHLATLAVRRLPDDALTREIERELLDQTQSHGIVLKSAEHRALMVSSDMPPKIDITVDMREPSMWRWLIDAFETLAQDKNRVMRVIGVPPGDPNVLIEIVQDELPMCKALIAFSTRILQLSIVISLFTAGFVYLSLQWLMVGPMRRITASMMAFRADPEHPGVVLPPTRRSDEIGIAQRELRVMQDELRAALKQKTRLATLGAAVAKVNHDLRNSLATAMLVSDRLANIDDPEVQKVTPRLYTAIDRAVKLCSQTLDYVSENSTPLDPSLFSLEELAGEVGDALTGPEAGLPSARWINGIDGDVMLEADREQLFRVLANLGRNAIEAGAKTVRVAAVEQGGTIAIDVIDDGPGLAPRARERLFQPFAGSARQGGTGLGLAIAFEIMRAHGGTIELSRSGAAGTTFRLQLPAKRASVA